MPEWTFLLCDHAGVVIDEMMIAPTVRRALKEPCLITHDLPHDDRTASQLFTALGNGIPQIKVYRDSELWARAWWFPMDENADADSSTMTCAWRGPLANVDMHFFASEYGTYTHPNSYTPITRDQAAHAHVIATATPNANSNFNDMDTGLFSGDQFASITRDRFYPAHKNRAEALVQLSEVIDGVEYVERPIPELTVNDGTTTRVSLARLDVGGTSAFGANKAASVSFQYGPGTLDNVVKVERQIGRPVNNVLALGAEWEDSNGQRFRFSSGNQNDQVSIDKYRLHRKLLELPDVKLVVTLQEHAQGELRPDPPQVVTFEPDPAGPFQPGPTASYWLGDTVSFLADKDALQIDTTQRIHAIEIDVDEDGNESAHRLEFGEQQARNLSDVIKRIERRANSLARSASS